jgi:hypothetical protein
MDTKEKPEIAKSVLFGIIGFIAFHLCFIFIYFLLGLIINLLFSIPIISNITGFFFGARGDTPLLFVTVFSVFYSCEAVFWMIHRFSDLKATEKLASRICGFPLVILDVIFLIGNIIDSEPLLQSIAFIIAGIAFIGHGAKEKTE